MRGWKKIFHANGNEQKAGVTILISHKIDFKIQETFNKDLEELKSKQTVINNTITEIKNTLEGINIEYF